MATIRSNITKGRQMQKRVMEAIKEAFQLDEDDIRVPVGCETGEDIKLSKKARSLVGLSIEVKNHKNLSIWAALAQAKKNCPSDCTPALVFKRGTLGANETFICVPLAAYLDTRKELLAHQGGSHATQ